MYYFVIFYLYSQTKILVCTYLRKIKNNTNLYIWCINAFFMSFLQIVDKNIFCLKISINYLVQDLKCVSFLLVIRRFIACFGFTYDKLHKNMLMLKILSPLYDI